jgi:outer membrane protein assembly factor BamB
VHYRSLRNCGQQDHRANDTFRCKHFSLDHWNMGAVMASNAVYVGIKGTVVALDRSSGTEIWRTSLKGSDFVNVVLGEGDLLAATKGELFCLDAATGEIRWHNRLSGLGLGLITVAPSCAQGNVVVSAAKRRRDQEAAAGAAAS